MHVMSVCVPYLLSKRKVESVLPQYQHSILEAMVNLCMAANTAAGKAQPTSANTAMGMVRVGVCAV